MSYKTIQYFRTTTALILTQNKDTLFHLEGVKQLFLKENEANVQLISPVQHLCEARCDFSSDVNEHVGKIAIRGISNCMIG